MIGVQAMAVMDAYTPARAKFEEIVVHIQSSEVQAMSHSEFERELETAGRELLRTLYQGYLDSRGPGATGSPVVGVDGVERTKERVQERTLTTVFGDVRVARVGYGAEGVESLRPLDAELNLPEEQYSLQVRKRLAEEAAKSSFEEAAETLKRTTGAEVPKRQVEELVRRAAEDFEAFYEERKQEGPAEAKGSLLVLSADGKGGVMRKEDLREQTRKAAEEKLHKMDKRLSPGEKRNAKRMATVAAVYTVEPFVRTPEDVVRELAPVRDVQAQRSKPENKRVWASVEQTPEQVIEEGFREAQHRDPQHEKKWVVLVDGNEQQLRIFKQMAKRFGVVLVVVLDVIHVLEYVWRAGFAFHPEGGGALQSWVSERFLQILHGRASLVAAGMRRSATMREWDAAQRAPVDQCADYLLKYSAYLQYDRYLADGLPIATGVIEGACRHLIKDRMDITGARWSLKGAEAVLRLRALRSSGDFDDYWRFHESREYERNHTSRYAGGTVPPTRKNLRSNKRPKLTLIK
jgi:plasmid stabilization system protein ParE